MKKLIILLLLVIVSSCDYVEDVSLAIDNQTEDTIEIIFAKKSVYANIFPYGVVSPPMHKIVFYEESEIAEHNRCIRPIFRESDVEVFTSSGRVLRKEIWDVNNWYCKGSFRNGWDLTFVITEEDLE